MWLGKRIKLFRKKRKFSAEQLASMVGVTKNNIYQIERCEHDPSMDLFIKLLNALNVTPEDILQDRLRIAAIDVFERTYSEINSTLSVESAKRCDGALKAIVTVWEKDL